MVKDIKVVFSWEDRCVWTWVDEYVCSF